MLATTLPSTCAHTRLAGRPTPCVPQSVCPGRAAHSDAGCSDALHDGAHADDAHGAGAGLSAPGGRAAQVRGGARGARACSEHSSGGRCWHAWAGECAHCVQGQASLQDGKLHVACSSACNGVSYGRVANHHAANHPQSSAAPHAAGHA